MNAYAIAVIADEVILETTNHVEYERFSGRTYKAGSEIQIGDMMKTWCGWHRVVDVKPYTHPMNQEPWQDQARIARWEDGSRITLDPDHYFQVA